jgi:tetratricopeptide (TPR) repeat protein
MTINMTNDLSQNEILSPLLGLLPTVVWQDLEAHQGIDKRSLARSFYRLGKIHYDKADLNKSEECFKESLKGAEKPGDFFTILKVLGFLIRIASEKLEDNKADAYISQAEELIEEMSRQLPTLTAEYFYNMAVIKSYRSLFIEANDNYLLAIKKSREENDPDLLAKSLLAISVNCYNQQDFTSALDYLGQLDQLLSIIDKSYLNGSMNMFSGKIYLALGEFDKALDHLQKANRFLVEKKCWNLMGHVTLLQGKVHKSMGEFTKSLMLFDQAMQTTDTTTFRRLHHLISKEVQDVNDSSVDIYLDRTNRKVVERTLGTIDFKHRFVLLEILFLLAKNSGSYYDKDKLAKAIWKDEYNPLIHDKLIYTSVSRLRKLIEPTKGERSERRKYIIRGKDGYTFNPDVKIRFYYENKVPMSSSLANIDLGTPV